MANAGKKTFYLGKEFDPAAKKLGDQRIEYDPSHLTTHGIITGMTGSGKTGLGVGVLEEAALQGIPAIVIDPKGDLTNLLLHFPDLLPEDFKPWIDPDATRRKGKSLEELAEETAAQWKNGLEGWGLGKQELTALKNSAQFAVYTPGSRSGLPVNVLASFQAPVVSWEEHAEVLREDIASSVTGLLALIGNTEIDPLRSREHILLSNILENAWSSGKSLSLMDLILQVQKPPFDRLGAFPLESFFPEKDRFELSMLLNNFLASPSFQTWLEGEPLDIGKMLYMPDGRPRHNVFYLAHLSEGERMFFVTLLFAAVEAWMRSQRGTGGLRCLIYFDEILGYLPPVANPPSRTIMLRMLKQARAFGVGLLLSTQNPVDVDYKALSNAGTWIIGRLQTEQDKNRLLDGLKSAAGGVDINNYSRIISGLGKRVFLLHNVHESKPVVFNTRWALNYLAGPLTRTQISDLNQLAGANVLSQEVKPEKQNGTQVAEVGQTERVESQTPPARMEKQLDNSFASTRPVVPRDLAEYFMPNNLGVGEAVKAERLNIPVSQEPEKILYKPALLVQAEARYLARKFDVDYIKKMTAIVRDTNSRLIRWDEYEWRSIESGSLFDQPMPGAAFDTLPSWLSDARGVKSLNADFTDWVYRSGTIRVRVNEALNVYAGPEVSTAEFRDLCSDAARNLVQKEIDKLEDAFDKKLDAIESKIKRQEMEVEEQKGELNQRRLEEAGTHGEFLLSVLSSRRRRSVSSSLSKRRMTAKAKAALEQEEQELLELEKQIKGLDQEKAKAIAAVKEKWADAVNKVEEVPITPYKKDIFIELFGVVWLPYYLFRIGKELREVPAYQ